MDVKDAVWLAAEYVADMESFAVSERGEVDVQEYLAGIDFAIEGVRYDETNKRWRIDVGFVRSWDRSYPGALAGLSGQPASRSNIRTYKEVVISDENGKVVSYGAGSCS